MIINLLIVHGSEVYSSASISYLVDSLNPIINSTIRAATGAFRSSLVVSPYRESGLKPLSTCSQIKALNFHARLFVNLTIHLQELVVDITLDNDTFNNLSPIRIDIAERIINNNNNYV